MPYSLSKDKLSVLDEDGKLVKRHKTQQQAKRHLAALMANDDDANKSGARHSAKDNAMLKELASTLNRAYELVCELGAMPDEEESPEEEMTTEEETLEEKPMKQALSFNYIKRLHLPHEEQYFNDVLAVKFVGVDEIKHYPYLWGSPQLTDVETDFFTPKTDFWDSSLPLPKPLTWDHGQDQTFKSHPVIGKTIEYGNDDIGRWAVSVVDRNHMYRGAIEKLIKSGSVGSAGVSAAETTNGKSIVGSSSDSANQYVIRERMPNGSNHLKQWPWFATALTPTPAEPRMLTIGSPYWKSAGVTLPIPGRVAPDGAQTQSNLALLEVLKLQV